METQWLSGRKQVYTDEAVITDANVVSVLEKALLIHEINKSEIEYLWDYYRGLTPIRGKSKEVRDNINHRININRAYEAVTFKLGYGFGEPIQYIRSGSDENLSDEITRLNEYMGLARKQYRDSQLAEWMLVCGLGIRMLLPGESEEEPLQVFTLDPRYSFVVKHNGLGEHVVMGVKIIVKEDGHPVYSVYTKDMYYEIELGRIIKSEAHLLGDVPIFCYRANQAMLGCFEVALNILDTISEIESNRMDDIEQCVNSFLALLGGTIDDETASKLNEYKMLCLPEGVDAKYLSDAMRQADLQVMVDSLYDAFLTICGIPNRNSGGSGGDNGVAVIYRDGYYMAETHMKSLEGEYKEADARFLKMALRILRDMVGLDLPLKNVESKFTRRNYDNLLTKSQVLTTMLSNPKIHPQLAYSHCGMFVDPESAYLQSRAWWEENERKEAEEMDRYVKSLGDDDENAVQ